MRDIKKNLKIFQGVKNLVILIILKKLVTMLNLVYLNYNDLQKKWTKENNLKFENNLKIFFLKNKSMSLNQR